MRKDTLIVRPRHVHRERLFTFQRRGLFHILGDGQVHGTGPFGLGELERLADSRSGQVYATFGRSGSPSRNGPAHQP